jgi:hypothetical protein
MELIMKHCLFIFILGLFGMSVFAQSADLTLYTRDFTRTDSTFEERLKILEEVRDLKQTGIGQFYHNCLRHLLIRNADIKNREDHNLAERAALILVQGLGAEKYAQSATELWATADYFDIEKNRTEIEPDLNAGNTQREAYIALGQVGGKTFVPHMVQRLNDFNAETLTDAEYRRRVQLIVVGLISALEAIKDHAGFRPVFNVVVGGYEPSIREIAYNALINMVDDPGDLLIEIIKDPATTPLIMQEAVRVMRGSKAPDESRAKVAAATLISAWNYHTTNRSWLGALSILRKGAIDDIRQYGIADNEVYKYLERSYVTNYNSRDPDYDEILKSLSTMASAKTDDASALLYKHLLELNERRRTGPWDRKERQLFEWVLNALQISGTQSADVKTLLTTIQRNDRYTSRERKLAESTLAALGGR